MPEGESSAGIFYDPIARKGRRRRKRITSLDELGEVRRALRILRRIELYLVQRERWEQKARARFLRESAKPDPSELAEQG